jgi:calcineurin-like phosphoesterase family protein
METKKQYNITILIKRRKESKMFYFTADLHLGHDNVRLYDDRQFATTDEMDEKIIENWNARVTDNDTVFILGDVTWHDDETTAKLLRRLKGKKVLIEGNHDNKLKELSRKEFAEIHHSYWEVKDPETGRFVVMSHYPIHFYNRQRHGAVMLYGHVHNMLDYEVSKEVVELVNARLGLNSQIINVGCMLWDYTPRTLKELMKGK